MHHSLPTDELKRGLQLAGYNLDYTAMADDFNELASLAAHIAGTDVSLINLIDSYTLWTIAGHGLDAGQMPREETVCHHTIAQPGYLEVEDLREDQRFKQLPIVTGAPLFRYYYGIPLHDQEGQALGSLCVFDTKPKHVAPEKGELLAIIAREIIKRLETYRQVELLGQRVQEAIAAQRVVAHDIRGPLAGIIGLAEVISTQAEKNTLKDVGKFASLIYKSGHSLIDLAGEIFETSRQAQALAQGETVTLAILKDKLLRLYQPQAENKKVLFFVNVTEETENIPLQKRNLLQIAGNLISNAIKFTPAAGSVTAHFQLQQNEFQNTLTITVQDTGAGISPNNIATILHGEAFTTVGTGGEKGYGYGLGVVKKLVQDLGGLLSISSTEGSGTEFTVNVVQQRVN